MPRKSLSKERTAQILDAFERCVVQRGLGGTSLEMVAHEAGVKRSILRHYIGNRDDLILAMAHRLTARYRGQLREMTEHVGDARRIDKLVDLLFASTSPGRFRDVILIESLIAASENNDELREPLIALVEETIDAVRDVLRLEHPKTDSKTLWSVAYGVVSIYFNHESLHPLSLPRRHRSSARASARRLMETLRTG